METLSPPRRKINAIRIDIDKLKNPHYSELYKNTLLQKLESTGNTAQIPQEQWNTIVSLSHGTAEQVLGSVKSNTKSQNPKIAKLSIQQKNLNTRINACKNDQQCSELRQKRHQILTKIHNILKNEERQKIIEAVEMIEKMKNNSQKMYQATRIIQQRGPKIPLLVESNHGVTTNEEEQVSKITTFFASFFDDKNVKDLLKAEPC